MTESFALPSRPLATGLLRRLPSWLGAACLLLAACTVLAREPLFVVRVAGVNRLLEDVDYLTALAERPELAGFVRGLPGIVNDLRGLDRARPICLAAYVPADGKVGKHMDVALLVPVTDTAALQKTIGMTKRAKLVAGESEGRFVLEAPRRTIPVRVIDGWAVVSEQEELLKDLSPESIVGTSEGSQPDIVVRLNWAGLPEAIRAEVIRKMERDRDQERTQRESEDEAEFAIRQGVLDVLLTAGRTILRDLSGTVLTVDIDAGRRQVVAVASFVPRDGCSLERAIAELPVESQFSEPVGRSAAGVLAISCRTPEFIRKGTQEVLDKIAARTDGEVTNEVEAKLVRQILDLVQDGLCGERYDGFVAVTPTEQSTISLAAAVRSGLTDEAETLLGWILPEAAKHEDVKSIAMKALVTEGIAFHRITPADPRAEDEEVFGAAPSIYIGTGHGAIWVGMGGAPIESTLKSLVSPAEPSDEAREGSPVAMLSMHLRPWAGIIAAKGDGPVRVRDAMADAIRAGEADEVSLKLRASEAGLTATLRADDLLLKTLFAAIAAEQGDE